MSARPATTRWLPPAASVAVHAVLLLALTAVTIEVARERSPARKTRVTLAAPPDAPASVPAEPKSRPDTPASASAPVTPAEPPALTEAVAQAGADGATINAPFVPTPPPVARAILNPHNGAPPRVRFADIDAAPARTVVFVVDASGAVASAFSFVREELLRSIDLLSPTQRFQVIVFPGPGDSAPVAAPLNRGCLALATPEAKRSVAEWMSDFRPSGRSRPLEGLRRALALEPDIALLITRSIERTGPEPSWGQGRDATLAELDRLNPVLRTGRRRTVIAAVQLLDEDPTGMMSAIAAAHGQDGSTSDYRVVTAETLAAPRAPAGTSGVATGTTEASAIGAAASLLAELDDSGVALRIFQGLADDADLANAAENAEQAARLAARAPDDPRARVLLARARSLTGDDAALSAAAEALSNELLDNPDADAWRRLAMVDALAAGDRIDEARDALGRLRRDAAELEVSRAVRARIAVTAAALGDEPADPEHALQQAPFLDDAGVTDPYWVLAMAEAMARGRLRSGEGDPFAPLAALLERAEQQDADAWPPILIERMARVATLAPDLAGAAPARARLEIAAAWTRSPPTRDRGRALLETLTAPGSAHRADALWTLGVLERSADTATSRARSADLLTTLALDHPDHPRAPDALAGAIALTTDPARLRPLLARATERLTDRPEIDLWRLQRAQLSTGRARLDALRAIAPGTRESTLACELFDATALDLWSGEPDPDARAAVAIDAAEFLSRHASPAAAGWLTLASDALLPDDPRGALSLAERALEPGVSDGAPAQKAHLAAARAELTLGLADKATARLGALATRLDAANDRSPVFWEAWTMLLETVADARPEAAGAHLARLKLIDPDLGGDPWRTRLNAAGGAS